MASLEMVSVALPAEIAAHVREAVEAGEYGSSSEVVLDALREWDEARREIRLDESVLRRAWQEAIEDTAPGSPAGEVLDRLERKYRASAENSSGTE